MGGDSRPGNMLATGIGSLPHRDPQRAVKVVLEAVPQLPYWPQLPRRHPLENMYGQFLSGLPGLDEEGSTPRIGDWDAFWQQLGGLLEAYLSGEDAPGSLPPERAAGLWALPAHRARLRQAAALKGQVTGPVSMGLSIWGPEGKPALYEERLMEAVVTLLRLKVRWQERFLRALHPVSLVFLDEPYLGTVGSAFYGYDSRRARAYLAEVLAEAQGLTGIHCCANTDWSLLLGLDVDVISFDAYFYFEPFALYAPALSAFLDRGGIVAWGIVPAQAERAREESAPALVERLEAYFSALAAAGVPRELLLKQGLVTPSCGLGSLREEEAEAILRLCGEVSCLARQRFRLGEGS